MSLEGPKALRRALSPAQWTDAGLVFGDWDEVQAGLQVQEEQIDLKGIATQQLTTFIANVSLQRSGIYGSTDTEQTSLQEWVLVTDTPWYREDIDAWGTQFTATGGAAPTPGFIYATDAGQTGSRPLPSWKNVIFGEFTHFAPDNTLGNVFVPAYRTNWGSGGATASDTLYITRMVSARQPTDPGTQTIINAMNVLIGVVIGEEGELPYMERLRRSYILQQGRDND